MRSQELGLLMIFDAIMTEGSITRAADRLAMTQPAVSNAVSRMRGLWKDELFVKDGRNIQATVYARNLWAQIREPLKELTSAVDPGVFDPATAERTFRIAVADAIVDIAWLPLRKLIEREAPGINVHAMPYTAQKAQQLLDDADVDLIIGAQSMMPGAIISEYLYDADYICIMRKGHPLAEKPLDIHSFANADHLLVTLSGDTTGFTDQALAQHGLRRRVAMTVNHFSAVAPLIRSTDLIAVVPSTVVENAICSKQIVCVASPIELPPNPLFCFWHKRQEKDLGLVWFRENLNQLLMSSAETHYAKLKRYYKQRS